MGGSVTYGATPQNILQLHHWFKSYNVVKLGVGREVNFARDGASTGRVRYLWGYHGKIFCNCIIGSKLRQSKVGGWQRGEFCKGLS